VVRVAAAVEAISAVVDKAVMTAALAVGTGVAKSEVRIIIPKENGKSYLTKSGTGFVRYKITRESRAEPSGMSQK
jgi:hypothetical protein